jgi:ribulose-5-phosphate 4-epimerase/fuculose-1-phosphate aldolase
VDELSVLKDKLKTTVKILQWELCDMWGHVSAKTPDGKHFLLAFLRPPADPKMPVDEVLEFDMSGTLLSGRRNVPDEIYFHLCPYKDRNDVGAVIHCHPPMSLAVVATGRKIIPLYQHVAHFGNGVPISPWIYGTMRAHGNRAVKLMGENCALMIKGHGAVVVGENIEEACMNMARMERTAKMMMYAAALGKPAPIPPGVGKILGSIYPRPGNSKQHERKLRSIGHKTEFQYYESLVKKGVTWPTI